VKLLPWLLSCAGLALLLAGSPFGWVLLGAAIVVLLCGVFDMSSGVFGRVRTTTGRDTIALTFDDGPDPASTPPLLDLLRERGVRATFFVVGERVRAHPAIVRRCAEEGHAIGNHSDRHRYDLNFRLRSGMRREMEACQEAVRVAAGVTPRLYRPPVGLMNPAVVPAARELGMEVVGWSIRSLDTRRGDAAERVIPRLRPGAIVLLHDGARDPAHVVATARRILDVALERGLVPDRLESRTAGSGARPPGTRHEGA